MACPCRAMRALRIARTLPLQTTLPLRPAFSAQRRLYSTPSEAPAEPPKEASPAGSPSDAPRAPRAPRRRTSPKTSPPTNVSFRKDTSRSPPDSAEADEAGEVPEKKRRRRTIAPKDREPMGPQDWQVQKAALKKKFPLGWAPAKKLSPDALSGLRALHAQFPDTYTTPVLSNLFGVSAEAVRRILRTKWSPATAEEEEGRRERWVRRGERVWGRWAAMGVKVPKKWREDGVSKWGGRGGGEQKGEGQGREGREGREEEAEAEVEGVRARRRVTGRIM